jgi:hypothetical protein
MNKASQPRMYNAELLPSGRLGWSAESASDQKLERPVHCELRLGPTPPVAEASIYGVNRIIFR